MNQSKLKKLQNILKEKDSDIFVINRSDEYLNEYISPNAERLNFITNFSGSAGRAIITPTDAFLYVDGRYTFQANTQINAKEIQAKHLNSFWTDLEKILLEEEYNIALDPTLHSIIENKKNAKSFCDALLAPKPGNITFQINSNNLEGGLSVSDEEVTKTIILLAEQLKIVVEPGGAVAAAAVLNNKIDVKNKKIIVMISGGNIDLSLFNKL